MAGNRKPTKPLVADNRYQKRRGASAAPKVSASKASGRTAKPKPKGNMVTRLFKWILRLIWKLVWAVLWRTSLTIIVLIGLAIGYVWFSLPPVGELLDGRSRGSVTLLDYQDEVFAWRGDQFGGVITAKTVSPHLKNAVIATEDKRFYRHFGLSPRGIASAVRINLSEGRGPLSGHGGSTITQQSAKLLCLGVPYDQSRWPSERAYEADCRQGSLWRKIKEAIYALAMEAKYSKDDILTIYLNRAFLGAGARGFEAAAQRYFGRSAADVGPAEAAMLAGLLVAPTRYAPTNNLIRSQNRAGVIIGLMEEQSYLSAQEAAAARQNPAVLSSAAEANAGGYFADWVMESGPLFFTRNTTEDVKIKTTLDPTIQRAAEEALEYVFTDLVKTGSEAQAAIVVMSADGAVRAMVGGRKLKVSGAFNRATQALRQTGSAFKPFVYATALELGYSPLDKLEDSPLTLTIPGSGDWSPKNYAEEFLGTVTLSEALTKSLNIPAVRLSEAIGRENVHTVAADFGLGTDLAEGPAIALGVSEATLIDMVGAYAGILNGGSAVTPYGLLELRLNDDNEPVMGAGGGIGERVIRQSAAEQLVYMMEKVVAEGTGQRAGLEGWQVAGKTGTTQAARDAWFIGFTADYVAGVWMGYDDNRPLTAVTGGGLPAQIWQETMTRVHQTDMPKPLPMSAPQPPGGPAPEGGFFNRNDAGEQDRPRGAINTLLRRLLGTP
ncbi:MAG: transglycosylase domain-containing protein [Paracoccaceae bacterium]